MHPIDKLFLVVALLFCLGGYSCHYHDDDHHDHHADVEDVTVEITGAAGLEFDAFFEDDDDVENVRGVVPFVADFDDQVGFFHAIADKRSGGQEEICLEVAFSGDSERSCTTNPFGRVSIAVSF